MKKLDQKVAIVTGAGAGIGKAIALLFAKEGAKVLATDINAERLEKLEDEASALKGQLSTLVVNMSVEADVETMIDQAKERYDGLHILVNNAGVMDNFEPVAEVENANWERIMSINVDGPFKAMRKAVQHFLTQGKGVILNVSSIGGLQGGRAGAAYTASKFALMGLSKNTAHMYAKEGIRCNVLAPGAVATSIAETIDFSKITPLVNDRIMSGMALNPRSGEPDELAKAAFFLCSDDASFVNGAVVVVDGGWTAY